MEMHTQLSMDQSYQKSIGIKLLYMLVSLPMGILYFTAVIVGIALSMGTMVLIIGFLLLWGFLMVWWGLAAMERRMVISWLGVNVPPMRLPTTKKQPWLRRFQMHLGDPVVWKSLLYLFAKLPFGVILFTLVVSMASITLVLCLTSCIVGLLAFPWIYLAMLLLGKDVSGRAVWQYMQHSLTLFGYLLFPLYICSAIADVWGLFARGMLGMSDSAMRIAQANAQTERERERAEEADKRRRELIVNVSHELRTPVASIRGHIESLMEAYEDREKGAPSAETLSKYLGIVHKEALRLGLLVDDLLSLARTETNDLRLNIAAVDAGEVVEEVYQAVMPLAKRERQITLLHEVGPGLPRVMADRRRLAQILLNLTRNAITYTPDGGIVSLTLLQEDADHLTLLVADTGMGIAPQDQARIFERFYRTDASRSRSSGGFGLGLAIVRDFVVAMGGAVAVESKVGEGSCFRVTLCVASQVAAMSQIATRRSAPL